MGTRPHVPPIAQDVLWSCAAMTLATQMQGSQHCSMNVRARTAIAPCATVVIALALATVAVAQTSNSARAVPINRVTVTFEAAPVLTFPNQTDSNSPAIWAEGTFYIFNSLGGQPRRAAGRRLSDVRDTHPEGSSSTYTDDVGSGRWLEAVIRDDTTRRLYGWYHNEIPTDCPQGIRLWPQIGAAVSDDAGGTWDNLGIILTPRDDTVSCATHHPMTNGGIGDFSVILDNNTDDADRYVYFIFSSYGGTLEEQGISFARMPWLNRDDPLDVISGQSAARKWDGEDWVEPGIGGRSIAIFHDDQQVSWTSPDNNGYWGPSVHWNRDLQEFVVLMSRSVGGNYKSGGIYMTHTARLDRPSSWTFPQLIIKDNQGWYPQVIGERRIEGTDKVSGARARYFNQGRSDSFIVFTKQSEPGARPCNLPTPCRSR